MSDNFDDALPNLSDNILDHLEEQEPALSPQLPDYVRDAAYALQPRPPLKWIIEEIISESSVNIWVGKFGSKKTWCALSAAVCAALGKDWLEHSTESVPVLFIDEDMGEVYLSERVNQAIRGEMGDASTHLNFCSMHGFDLRKPASINDLQVLITAGNFQLVFIDALANVMPGGDENAVKDIQPLFTNLRRLSDSTGASFVLLHHESKMGQYRGSTAIPGGVDMMLLIKSEEGSEFINFETGKHRRGKPIKLAARACWPTPEQFYLTTAPVQEKNRFRSKAERHVLDWLEEHGASPLPDIMAGAAICAPTSARAAVYALADRGEIKRINQDERGMGVSAIYALVNKVENE
jgi:hypothetical protein